MTDFYGKKTKRKTDGTKMNKQVTGLRYSKDNWFTCVDTDVLMDLHLSGQEKLVFSVLCMFAGLGYREVLHPDIRLVACASDLSVSAVQRIYRDLENKGVIIRDKNMIHLIGHNAPCYGEEEER